MKVVELLNLIIMKWLLVEIYFPIFKSVQEWDEIDCLMQGLFNESEPIDRAARDRINHINVQVSLRTLPKLCTIKKMPKNLPA